MTPHEAADVGVDEPAWVKAPLLPTEWAVLCPCCGDRVPVEEVYDDDAGVFHGADESCAVVECAACNIVIEVGGVRIVPTDHPPRRAGQSFGPAAHSLTPRGEGD